MTLFGFVCHAGPDANLPKKISVVPLNVDFKRGVIDFKLVNSGKENILINMENLKVFYYEISGQGGYMGGILGERIYHNGGKTFFILQGKRNPMDENVVSRTITADLKFIKEAQWQDSELDLYFYISGYTSIDPQESFLFEIPMRFRFSIVDSLPTWKLIEADPKVRPERGKATSVHKLNSNTDSHMKLTR